jgi:hypothetical protein
VPRRADSQAVRTSRQPKHSILNRTQPGGSLPMSKSNRVLIDAKDIPQDLKKLVGIVGSDKFFEIVKEYGGESIYIPKVDTFYRSDRNRKIVQEFTGSNYRELAKKYRLTDKMIRYILENKKDKRSHGSA